MLFRSVFSSGGDINSRIKNTYDYFDWIAAQKGQDPNVLRAYFVVRTQMGLETPGTENDIGWGDFSKELGPGDGASHVKLMASTYAGYMQKFGNVPSVALLATDLTLSSKSRSKYIDPATKQLQTQISSKLQQIATMVKQSKDSDKAVSALRNL